MSSDPQQTCQAAVFLQAREPLQLQSFRVPEPQAGEAIVRVDLCTICGSDIHTVGGLRSETVPTILGHEIVGTVNRVGDPPPTDIDGNRVQVGERITWAVCAACGQCDRCQGGLPQKCRQLFKYGHNLAEGRGALSGGLAEYLLLRAGSAVLKLSDNLPDRVACPANCATATIAAAYRVAGTVTGKRVLVLGAGMLGLTATAFVSDLGADSVAVCDQDASRLRTASQFGADMTFSVPDLRDSSNAQLRFDTIIECSGSPDAVELGYRLGDVGATLVLVGSVMDSRKIQLDPQSIVRRWLSIHGVHNYTPQDLQTAVQFLQRCQKRFPFESLVEKTYALPDINEAIEYARSNRPIRVAVRSSP